MMTASRAFTALLDVAFPPRCAACGAGGVDPVFGGFCVDCFDDLEFFDSSICERCSTPLVAPPRASEPDCPACRQERWAFDAVVALGPYEGLLRRLVLEAKRSSGEAGASALGRLLAERAGDRLTREAVVTPIPPHWRRRLARRADGVAALAQALASRRGLSVASTLKRVRATRRQTEITPSERLANLRRAFVARRPASVAGRTVLLVDDVFTTGATCQAAARELKRAGAARVVAVVAARRVGGL